MAEHASGFTDAEIIKALERCKHGHGKCTTCPLYPEVANGCQNILIQGVLDLINRKNEMIDALIAGQETLQKAIAERDEEIKKCRSQMKNLEDIEDDYKEILKNKKETIKSLRGLFMSASQYINELECKLVKEMTEESQ